jgi:hypothetical protein
VAMTKVFQVLEISASESRNVAGFVGLKLAT